MKVMLHLNVLVMPAQEEAHAAGGPACTSDYSIYGKALSDGSSAVMILNREQATIPSWHLMSPFSLTSLLECITSERRLASQTLLF